MKTGIIGAMDSEVSSLKGALEGKTVTRLGELEFCEGRLEGAEVVVVRCGIGKVNAGICAQLLITRFGVGRIVNTGVAGSLDERIEIGDIVISSDAVQHDYDLSPIGFALGEIPDAGRLAFPADPLLRAQAADAVHRAAPEVSCFSGRVCSGDQFIATREQKAAIRDHFGGLCCEMEGGAIAQVCSLNRIPYVILRAISDKADGSGSADYGAFEATAARRCASIVRTLAGLISEGGSDDVD